MLPRTSLVLLSLLSSWAAADSGAVAPNCVFDACLEAVRSNRGAPIAERYRACTSFFMVTVTPSPVTATSFTTVTQTNTISRTAASTTTSTTVSTSTQVSTEASTTTETDATTTETTTAVTSTTVMSVEDDEVSTTVQTEQTTSTETDVSTDSVTSTSIETDASTLTTVTGTTTSYGVAATVMKRDLEERAGGGRCPTTSAGPSPVPASASACSSAAAYSSACSCVGVSHSTVTISPCTTTLLRTRTTTTRVTSVVTTPTTTTLTQALLEPSTTTTSTTTTTLTTETSITIQTIPETDTTTSTSVSTTTTTTTSTSATTESDTTTTSTTTATTTSTTATQNTVATSVCDIEGLEWASYPNNAGPYYGSDPYYFNFDPTSVKQVMPMEIGITPEIGIQSVPTTLYGGSESYDMFFIVNHRAYLVAEYVGDYSFILDLSDDGIFVWIGPTAYSGWSRSNANDITLYNAIRTSTFSYTNTQAGAYIPFRVVYVQAQGGAAFAFTIIDPNGNPVLSSTSAYSPNIVAYSCDGSAPPFPAFGNET